MRMLLGVLLGGLAACGGDDATTDPPDDDPCLVPADHGAVGALPGFVGAGGGVVATMTLDPGPPEDLLVVQLVAGAGVFADGIAPGTYAIGGVDADYDDCGLCVQVIADLGAGLDPPKYYFAQSGSVTLTMTSPAIVGSAQDLVFREVDSGTGADVPGGCQTTIGSASFDAD